MYKLSDKSLNLISEIIKDSNKKDYKISSKKDMEEFCFTIALLMGFSKNKTPEQEEKSKKITAVLEEIHNHLDEIDYEDFNQRIKL